jgi:hypothetical protein
VIWVSRKRKYFCKRGWTGKSPASPSGKSASNCRVETQASVQWLLRAADGFVADPSLVRNMPLGRLGRSEDLALVALAVLSNRVSACVTGAAIVVEGGLSLTNWFDPPALDDL